MRPPGFEQRRRQRVFLLVLAESGSFEQAFRESRLSGRQLARFLDGPEVRQAAFGLAAAEPESTWDTSGGARFEALAAAA